MGRCIIKIDDQYFEWSTITDAPITYGMTRAEFKAYYKERYGIFGIDTLPGRLDRVDIFGTSMLGDKSVDDTIACNRAGPNEGKLTKAGILKHYGRRGRKRQTGGGG